MLQASSGHMLVGHTSYPASELGVTKTWKEVGSRRNTSDPT